METENSKNISCQPVNSYQKRIAGREWVAFQADFLTRRDLKTVDDTGFEPVTSAV